jgi:hypothetical protein
MDYKNKIKCAIKSTIKSAIENAIKCYTEHYREYRRECYKESGASKKKLIKNSGWYFIKARIFGNVFPRIEKLSLG